MSVALPYQPGLSAIFFILPSSILSLAVLRHVTISGFCRQNEWGLYVRGRASERGRAPEKGGREKGEGASASGIGIGKATELARAAAACHPSLVPIRKTIYPECSHLDV